MTAGWVYFATNRPNGILYVGVTETCRAARTPGGLIDGFTKR
jgi:putative endonuclease